MSKNYFSDQRNLFSVSEGNMKKRNIFPFLDDYAISCEKRLSRNCNKSMFVVPNHLSRPERGVGVEIFL